MNNHEKSTPAITAKQVYAHRIEIGERLFAPGGGSIPFSPAERELTLLHRWHRMVEIYGERPALEEGERTLTYAEVNAMANRIAHAIRAHRLERDVAGDVPVGLLFDVEGDMLLGVLAVWKAGAFFTWFEPRQPLHRSQYIVEESGTAIAVTNRKHEELARQLWPDADAVIVIEDLPADLPVKNPPTLIDASQPAYLLYTSGSTGNPKGIVDLHGHLVRLMAGREKLFHFGPNERSAFLLYGVALIFAVSVAWMYGGCVLPFRIKEEGLSRFSQWLIEKRVTFVVGGADVRTWLLTLDGSQQFPDLRMVISSTSPCYREHWLAYCRYLPDHCVFANLYSATEFRPGMIYFMDKTTEPEGRLIPAGYAVPPTVAEIWDENGKALARGETGEVVIVSPDVAQGYWKSPELTASKFGVDSRGRRYYRTGDLGRLDEQNCLWVLGRKDGQVKIRGNRVETAEIEVALLELPAVREAAVIAIGDSDDERMLLGFVAADGEVAGDALRKQLEARLPDYMIPARVIVLGELPRNANGKVARPLLREMATAFSKIAPEIRPSAPRFASETEPSETEQRVAAIVSEVLDGATLGPHDDFFDHGGHSLLAARLMLEIERAFGVELPPHDFFARPTVAALAERVEAALARQAPKKPVIPQESSLGLEAVQVLSGSPTQPPLFFCLGWNGSLGMLMRYQELIRRLGNQWSLYGLVANGCNDPNKLFATVDELVDAAFVAMRMVQPHGPYMLMGECLGGKLAFELARRLVQEEEEVALLMLLDSPMHLNEAGVKRQAVVWLERIDHHARQLAMLGWRSGTRYLLERMAALLPGAVYARSSYRQRYLAHKRYAALLSTYQPSATFHHPAKAIFTSHYQPHLQLWMARLPELDATVIEGKHQDYLVSAGDEVVALLRQKIEEALAAHEHSSAPIKASVATTTPAQFAPVEQR